MMCAVQPGLYAAETLWEKPLSDRTPECLRGTTLMGHFLERAAGLSEAASQCLAGNISGVITLKYNEGSCFFL